MAVFQEQDDAGYRFVVRPNCALSWRTTKYLIWFFAACFAAVGSYFASLGAWLVLPFAGLELVVVVAGFYLSAIAGHTREVIEIDGPVLRVLRGGRQLNEVASFPANWTRVVLQRDPTGWYPSRLLLRCHESRLEIAAKIVEAEREELARALEDWVGFAALGGGGAQARRCSYRVGRRAGPRTARASWCWCLCRRWPPGRGRTENSAAEQGGKVFRKRVLENDERVYGRYHQAPRRRIRLFRSWLPGRAMRPPR